MENEKIVEIEQNVDTLGFETEEEGANDNE
jgi:hypothetical protein